MTSCTFEFRELALPGVVEIKSQQRVDHRGRSIQTFQAAAFDVRGFPVNWVEHHHTVSFDRGVLRGLHYQRPPYAQDKLVRVTRGAVLDVVVDIRRGSATFAKWVSCELSADKWNEILVPQGYAHGFVTLSEGTEVLVKVSREQSPDHFGVIRYDDPAIGIDWQLDGMTPIMSERDESAPLLHEQETGFALD